MNGLSSIHTPSHTIPTNIHHSRHLHPHSLGDTPRPHIRSFDHNRIPSRLGKVEASFTLLSMLVHFFGAKKRNQRNIPQPRPSCVPMVASDQRSSAPKGRMQFATGRDRPTQRFLRPVGSKRHPSGCRALVWLSSFRPCGIRHDVFIHVPLMTKSIKIGGKVQILA